MAEIANTKKYVSLDKLGIYNEKIKGVISAGDAAALQAAKDYADGLAVNYDEAGAANTALESAKAYADGKDAAIQAAQSAAEAAASAASVADGKAVAAHGKVDDLEAYVGTFTASEGVDTVVKYIDKKTEGIASNAALTALDGRVTAAEGTIAVIEANYLDGDDKTALEGQISAVQIAVDTEKGRAEGIEAGLRTDIDKVMGDYLKAADKTELQGNINTLTGVVETLRDGVDAEKVDGVKDLIDYVDKHGATVTGLQEGIDANAEAIDGVAGRMTTAEGDITSLQGAVATKVEQSVYDAKIAVLESADAGQVSRIANLEAKFGGAEGSVEDMIADAKQAAIDAAAADATTKSGQALVDAKAYADAEDAKIESRVDALEAASSTHALASDLSALDGRVTTAEGKITTLEGKMTVVEGKVAANESAIAANAAAIAKKAAADDLSALDARVVTLETWHANFTEVSEAEINGLFA